MGAAIALVAAALILNLVATAAIIRTDVLNRFQKWSQALFVWLVPVVGAWVVLALLAEADPSALRSRWSTLDSANPYLMQLLRIEARGEFREAPAQIEHDLAQSHAVHGGTATSEGGAAD